MVDQDTALALTTIAARAGATLALMGDRHQLRAVGRGGFLEIAAQLVPAESCLTLDRVHRFSDPEYAELSLAMRDGRHAAAVFDSLLARGQIILHPTTLERTQSLAERAAESRTQTPHTEHLLVADTRDEVDSLNAAVRDRLVASGAVDSTHHVTTASGTHLGVGDRISTRHNDRDLDVVNRELWTVTGIEPGGAIVVSNARTQVHLPADYVRDHVHLAYAGTTHASQGETTDEADVIVNDTTTAAAAYVGMTRGRHVNRAHLVAASVDEARATWTAVFEHDRADLGPAAAAEAAAEAIERYGPALRPPTALEIEPALVSHGLGVRATPRSYMGR